MCGINILNILFRNVEEKMDNEEVVDWNIIILRLIFELFNY